MKILPFYCIAAAQLLISACERIPAQPPAPSRSSKRAATLRLRSCAKGRTATHHAQPPPGLFRLVHYPSPVGALAAYVSVAPADGQRRPAIIWLVGGFSNGIGEVAWEPGPRQKRSICVGLSRGGSPHDVPLAPRWERQSWIQRTFYGEVDDVLSAIDYLRKLEIVDPERIYLGGHSTGGTLALLAAECGVKVRAIFAFGPVEDVAGYGPDVLPFDTAKPRELELRAPNAGSPGFKYRPSSWKERVAARTLPVFARWLDYRIPTLSAFCRSAARTTSAHSLRSIAFWPGRSWRIGARRPIFRSPKRSLPMRSQAQSPNLSSNATRTRWAAATAAPSRRAIAPASPRIPASGAR